MKRIRNAIIGLGPRRRPLVVVGSTFILLFVILALPSSAHAGGVCQIGLTIGSSITGANIDGDTSSGWADANVIQSGSPCLDDLMDWNGTTAPGTVHVVPSLDNTIRLLSKRDATHLYLAFEVEDQTQNRQDPGNTGSPLLLGEKLIVQIDPDNSGGTDLGNSSLDYRVELSHKWGSPSTLVREFYDSGTVPSESFCGRQDWRLVEPLPVGLVANFSTTAFTGGYSAELKIPLSAIGNPGGDIGIAFAVINDLGYCVDNCDASGAAFPNSLPINNASSVLISEPDNPTGCGDWLTPDNWGTGYFNDPLPIVWISHDPAYWQSQDLPAFKCDSVTPDYTYHPGTPCRVRVRATIHNDGLTPQIRNLLFLWGFHGAGIQNWRVIELVEGVSVPASDILATSTEEWSPPSGLAHHPCLRVYILPPAYEASFDKDDILAINNATDLTAMLTAYGLAETGAQSAQKNITRLAGTPDCTPESCQIAAVPGGGSASAANVSTTETRKDDRIAPWMSLTVALPLVGAAFLLQRRQRSWRRLTSTLLLLSLALMLVVAGCTGAAQPVEETPPVETPPVEMPPVGPALALTDEEMKLFGADNVVVQFEVFGFSKVQAKNGQNTYNFIEDFGGVIQLIPTEMLKDFGQTELAFNISNPTELHQIMMVNPAYAAPDGLDLELRYDIDPQLFQPQQQLQFSNAILHLPDITPKFPFEGAGLEGGAFLNEKDLLVLPNGDAFAFERFLDDGFIQQLQDSGLIDQVFETPQDVPIVKPIP